MLEVFEESQGGQTGWPRQIQGRVSEHIGRRMMRLEMAGRRLRGRSKRRSKDAMKQDMKLSNLEIKCF